MYFVLRDRCAVVGFYRSCHLLSLVMTFVHTMESMAVLRVWGVITERGALPRKRFLVAARLGADRLRDQSSLVRKEAVKVNG